MQTNIKFTKQTFTVYLKIQKISGAAIILNLPQKAFHGANYGTWASLLCFYHSLTESRNEVQASPVHLPLPTDMNSCI